MKVFTRPERRSKAINDKRSRMKKRIPFKKGLERVEIPLISSRPPSQVSLKLTLTKLEAADDRRRPGVMR